MRSRPIQPMACARWAVLFLLLYAGTAGAQLTDTIREMRTTTFAWHIKLVDTQGQPIPAGTLWAMNLNPEKLHNTALMERMVHRYAADNDFIQFSNEPGPFIALRFGRNGEFRKQDSCICEKKETTNIYAVLKRGYKPKVFSATVRKNSTSETTITLESDPQSRVDSRMLEMDLLRAGTHSPAQEGRSIMNGETVIADRAVNQQMRALAQSLEADKQLELASAVYYSLAYLPSVITIARSNGKEEIVGFSNGYSDKNPQSKADLKKALDLNQSTPTFSLSKARYAARKESALKGVKATKEDWIQMNQVTEEYIKKYGERLWPKDYSLFVFEDLGLWEKGCFVLKRAKAFEPTRYDDDDTLYSWGDRLQSLNKNAGKAGYTGPPCSFTN